MYAPASLYLPFVNCIFKNLPNRDELLFRNVLALPKDSRIGDESTTFCSSPDIPPTDRCVKNLKRRDGVSKKSTVSRQSASRIHDAREEMCQPVRGEVRVTVNQPNACNHENSEGAYRQ